MNRIAIIPARSGSKGIPNKNIKELKGKPLIAYTIEAALECNLFDRIHVSTDTEKYATIAREYGADVPFLRSMKNSSDVASSWDVIREVLNKYKNIGEEFVECMLLQPTSPLRNGEDIKKAYDVFKKYNADSGVSVCEVAHPVQWCFPLDVDLSMKSFYKNPYKNLRRQELEKQYCENGAIYFLKTAKIHNSNFDFYSGKCFAYIMDRQKSLDIDLDIDFKIASVLMENK